jgi:hypothetical protein
VVQNAKGDQWVIEGKTFAGLYQRNATDEQEREIREKETRDAKEAAALLAAAQAAQQMKPSNNIAAPSGADAKRGPSPKKPKEGSTAATSILPPPSRNNGATANLSPASIMPHNGDSKERGVLNERKTFVEVARK